MQKLLGISRLALNARR